MSIPARILSLLAILVVGVALGWFGHAGHVQKHRLEAQVAQERATRVLEAQAVRNVMRSQDALLQSQRALADARTALDRRVRDEAARYQADHPGPACRADAPTVARLPEAARTDLVRLAADADDTAITLGVLQQYVTELTATCRRIGHTVGE